MHPILRSLATLFKALLIMFISSIEHRLGRRTAVDRRRKPLQDLLHVQRIVS